MESPAPPADPARISDEIERWLLGEGDKTLGSLVELFGKKSFAVIFLFLLGLPALPLPTGGATHVLEIIAMLLSLQLIAGRQEVWLPERWLRIELAGEKQQKFVNGLLKVIRWFERWTRPRLRGAFEHRVSSSVFGLLILLLSIAAFVAPPFSGLDTLPALGGVVVSLAVLVEDIAMVILGLAIGVFGVALEIVVGRAALSGIEKLF
ncbi:MAG TPA: exopolysaccharide biosynthesis protein [Solirubrobacteraceae bacterium]|jgi:hypothetical protein